MADSTHPTEPTPPDHPEFRSLLAAAQAGDQEALATLLGRTEDRLRKVIDQRLGPRLRASLRRSDILQNSYLAMLEALPRFSGDSEQAFVAWLAQIIENDIRRQHRWFNAGKRRPPSQTSEKNLLADILMRPIPTPSAEAAAGEERSLLRKAMAQLEPDHLRVIELAEFEGLPHKEVAERMGRSEGACRMLLLRARMALALALERLANDQQG
jgi:RNA polymerase sigma-70 factor (ECF subfamily)